MRWINKRIFLLLFVLVSLPILAQAQSTPPITASKTLTAVVGVKFTYQLQFFPMSRDSAAFWYKLIKAPAGMTIDSTTGLIQWTPAKKGVYIVEAVAIGKHSMLAISQFLSIDVVNFLGTISGTVKNSLNVPLPNIQILILNKKPSIVAAVFDNEMTILTDSIGSYTAKVDSGSYYIQARPYCNPLLMSAIPCFNSVYLPEWYDNSPTLNGATAVLVSSPAIVTADFTLHKLVKPVPEKISGIVTDTSGTPIANTQVIVSLASNTSAGTVALPEGEKMSAMQDSNFGVFVRVLFTAMTDKSGKYTITADSGMAYFVSAHARGYLLQYYNGENNELKADTLKLSQNTTGINFALSPVPVVTASISGSVKDSSGTGVVSRVILYVSRKVASNARYDWDRLSRSIHTDSTGLFTFEKVPNGKYIIQVVPFKGYMPAFYSASDCGARSPKLADSIIVANQQSVSGLDVCVKAATGNGGGSIRGFVKNANGAGLSGVVVSATGSNGNTDNLYGTTGSDGSYLITNLDAGSYTLSADKVGFNSSELNSITIDYSSGIFNSNSNNLVLSDNSLTEVQTPNALPVNFELDQNYPNPFNPSTIIKYSIPANSFVQIRVYDVIGREVSTLVKAQMNAGTYNVTFNADNMPSGIYFYRIEAGNFIQTRKMILLK
jgi:hypothetical protein